MTGTFWNGRSLQEGVEAAALAQRLSGPEMWIWPRPLDGELEALSV